MTTIAALLPFAALFINLSLVLSNPAWVSSRRGLLWTSCLPLLGWLFCVGYTAVFVAPMGKDAYGPGVNIGWPPRVAFLTYALWVIAISWQGLNLRRS